MGFCEINIEDCDVNFIHELSTDYSLVSATSDGRTNMLTAAWAQLGFLWNRPVATVYIRPSRYTKEFIDASGRFTVSFIKDHPDAMLYLGRHSGRDEDKLAKTDLDLIFYEGDPVYEQAFCVLICKVIYVQQLDLELFKDKSIIDKCYPQGNVSIGYVGQIEKILVPDSKSS